MPRLPVAAANVATTVSHYHAMDYWDTSFPEIAAFVRNNVYRSAITDRKKKTVVRAEVKSGKRLVAECFASYTNGNAIINVFISCYIRKADAKQRKELADFMTGGVFGLNTKRNAAKFLQRLRTLRHVHPDATIVVHHDEFDHGSGTEQIVGTSGVWDYICACPAIRVVQYSASPEEGLLIYDDDRRCVVMPNHPNYRGATYYLESDLVHEAEKPLVFDEENKIVDVSEQLKQIINSAKTHVATTHRSQTTPYVVVRIVDKFAELQKAYQEQRIPDLVLNDDDDVIVDCSFVASTSSGTKTVLWDDYAFWENDVKRVRRMNCVQLLFIDKMCTRSTDWFCHPFLFAYHDYHGEGAALNTLIQSNLRVAYYVGKKNNQGQQVYGMTNYPIQLYGSRDVIEYVAGQRSLEQISRKVSSRTNVRTADPGVWGRPIHIMLPTDVIRDERIIQPLASDEQREWIKQRVLEATQLTAQDRERLENRTVAGKRSYNAGNTLGGIHTVHSRYVEGRESAPGGGVGNERLFDNRSRYFWIDIAQEITNGIPIGTVYITYGLPDPDPVDDESDISSDRDSDVSDDESPAHVHSLAYDGTTGQCRSIFGIRPSI
jgi:hypothetical protein